MKPHTIIIALFSLLSSVLQADKYETPEYQVLEQDGAYEIRSYPELLVAQVQSENSDDNFRALFKYISGQNEKEQKIAMTTPVFMPSNNKNRPTSMHFIFPSKFTLQDAPAPKNPDITLKILPASTYAVLRESGRLGKEKNNSMHKKLSKWVTDKGYRTHPERMFAGYNAPWTPGWFRRNEVLLRLIDPPQAKKP